MLPLFEAYPILKEILPYVSLVEQTTPIEKMQHPFHKELYTKRDDLSSSIYGGNKVRKLEFLLGDMLQRKTESAITIGAIGSNHCVASALFCAQQNIAISYYLFNQPRTSVVEKNYQLLKKYATNIKICSSMLQAGRSFYTHALFNRNDKKYFIAPGGSSPLGILGFVNAAFELKEQLQNEKIAIPDYIVCALGSMGTSIGLSLGCQLAQLPCKVIAVRVVAKRVGLIPLVSKFSMVKLQRDAIKLLNQGGLNISPKNFILPEVWGDYLGQGYGYSTEASELAVRVAKSNYDLTLETTYTGKTFAAILDNLETHFKNKKVLYWHTFNSQPLNPKS